MKPRSVNHERSDAIGREVDRYCDIAVFENGPDQDACVGRHYHADGYYYGQKWQCVEFVKRFYYLALKHRMPNVWGHAKDYFDNDVDHGELNPNRNLIQFKNGGQNKPEIHDILVFSDTRFGHLAIVTEVSDGQLRVIQQNIAGIPRQVFRWMDDSGTCKVISPRIPDGWLRIPGFITQSQDSNL